MKTNVIVFCVCLLFGSHVRGQKNSSESFIGDDTSPLEKFNPVDVADSAKDILKGVVEQIPDSIPTVGTILFLSKNVLAGVPFELGSDLINKACSAAITQKEIKPKYLPDITKMHYIFKTCRGDFLIPLQTPEKLLTHPEFDSNKKTAILVTGWPSNINSTLEKNVALERVWEAFKCRGTMNFISIDTAAYLDTLYTWSSFNTDELGKLTAESLVNLLKGYPRNNIHLIGHSLGAHIVGAIGRYYYALTETMLPRITGLDPASICFNEGENLNSLSRGDAEFVDIIHSDGGILGEKKPVGDVDFYPNGVNPLPPGCLTFTCAHDRSWEFFAESVKPGNEDAFLAVRCNSITSLNSGKCTGKRIPMGFACPDNAKGNYFLNTNHKSPFGKQGLKESQITCSECEYTVR